MREDRIFRAHFRSRVTQVRLPANPWIVPQSSGQPQDVRSRWQEEGRPGWGSLLGYALSAACLLLVLSAQAAGLYQDAVSQGLAVWGREHPLERHIQEFMVECLQRL